MTGNSLNDLNSSHKVVWIVRKCPKMSENVQFRSTVARTDLFLVFLFERGTIGLQSIVILFAQRTDLFSIAFDISVKHRWRLENPDQDYESSLYKSTKPSFPIRSMSFPILRQKLRKWLISRSALPLRCSTRSSCPNNLLGLWLISYPNGFGSCWLSTLKTRVHEAMVHR